MISLKSILSIPAMRRSMITKNFIRCDETLVRNMSVSVSTSSDPEISSFDSNEEIFDDAKEKGPSTLRAHHQWLQIRQIPKYANLNDVKRGLERMKNQINEYNSSQIGNDDSLKINVPDLSIQDAKYYLARDYSVRGFFVKFPTNEDMNSIFATHMRKNLPMLSVGWKAVLCRPSTPKNEFDKTQSLGNHVLRVQGFEGDYTAEDIRKMFERFGLANEVMGSEDAAVEEVTNISDLPYSKKVVYLVRFESPAAARMASLEIKSQQARFKKRWSKDGKRKSLFIYQYPDLTSL